MERGKKRLGLYPLSNSNVIEKLKFPLSRVREYETDAEGAVIRGNPEWLASALNLLGILSGRIYNIAADRPQQKHLCSLSIRCTCKQSVAFLPRIRPLKSGSQSCGN